MEPEATDAPRCVAPNRQSRHGTEFLVTKSRDTAAASSWRRLRCPMFRWDTELFDLFRGKDPKHVCRRSPPRSPRLSSRELSWGSHVAKRGEIATLVASGLIQQYRSY